MAKIAIVLLWLVAQVSLANATVDATLQAKANGIDVVRSTISKIHKSCIFPNDFGFMLRVALVESNFGENSHTFRTDAATGGKGIWQMDRIGFDDTKLVNKATLDKVKEKFGIDWTTMTYASENMNVPLYNALAARLLLYRKPAAIPPGVEAQANYWKTYYNSAEGKGTVADFINKVQSRPTCGTVGADLLFILDASGSIGSSSFELMKQVLISVAKKFTIGPSATQVAVITFDSQIQKRIDFGNYPTFGSLTTAITNLRYTGGGTMTHLALNLVASMFSSARSLELGFPRVVIVLTDGASNSPTGTVQAVNSLNAYGWLERYAVGMGSGINNAELQAIASACSNVYLIPNTSYIAAITDDLYDLACRSSVALPLAEGSTGYATMRGSLNPGTRRNARDTSVSREKGRTYALMLTSGRATLYVSRSMENPSSALNDFSAVATPSSPGLVFVSSNDLKASPLRRKRDTSNATTNSNIYLSIVPADDSASVNFWLDARDGDFRNFYRNSAPGCHANDRWPRLAWIISMMIPTIIAGKF